MLYYAVDMFILIYCNQVHGLHLRSPINMRKCALPQFIVTAATQDTDTHANYTCHQHLRQIKTILRPQAANIFDILKRK